MSVSSEVRRTLVKSPPELWAELSDPAALARQLEELGEIRIVRVEPEEKIEWEATDTHGTVQLKPSGWGTKVTLTVTREIPEAEPIAAEPEAEADADAEQPLAAPEPAATPEAEPVVAEPRAELEVPAVVEEPLQEAPLEPEPQLEGRRGFFARLFRRRKPTVVEPVAPESVELEPEQAETAAVEQPEPVALQEPDEDPVETPAEDLPDIAAELQAAEEVAAEHVTAVLTNVLDRLGAAHHRPFSRS
jgi:hypothetical protein